MAVTLRQFPDGSWGGEANGARFFVDDDGGRPNTFQRTLADQIVRQLDSIRTQAVQYLDLFVDRTKVCGNGNEDWWLEEIDMRGRATPRGSNVRLIFTIVGDDGGYWYVQFSQRGEDIRPYEFGRSQG